MIKKYSKYILTILVAFFISLTVTHAKELSLSELADEVLEVEPNATSVFIIGQHVFTSEHLLTTQDTMLAARTIQTSTNSAGQEIYNEMTIAYFDGTYDDDWNVVGFEFYQNIVGTTQSKNSYDICYIDYTYICDGSSGGETPSTYTIIWKNYDDSVLETDTNVNAGITPSYDGETPVRESDETYTYEFIGWTPELTADSIVSGNMVYTAKYRETYIDYTVIFQDEDGTKLSENTYHYGDTVVEPAAPTKEATDEYTYTFAGWDKEITTVSGDVTYTATYTATKNKYTITFVNYDGTTLYTSEVEYGIMPSYAGETPVRVADEENTYTFTGWSPALTNVTGEATYTAQYTTATNVYTVTWKNYDGTVLETDTVEYGTVPTYDGEAPVKTSDNTYTYAFDTWDREVVAVTGNTEYIATFNETYIDYTVIFQDEDGTELSRNTYHYGDTVVEPADPTKEATDEYTYTFAGWDKEVTPVSGDVTYTAQYTTATNVYTVTWVNEDGTVLETDTVEYGTVPTYDGSAPTKTSDEQYDYYFAGWDRNIEAVTQDAVYEAEFGRNTRKYTITFVNYDGTTLYTSEVEYGTVPSYAGETPVRAADEENSYTFTGWSPALTNVTGEATYTAQYTTATNVYTVTWKNYDGTVLETDTVEYGTVPTYDGEAPVKTSDNTYTYAFDTWDREVVAVTGNTEYIATFNETYIDYTVIFQDDDGTKLSENTYHYGDTVVEPADPTKEATDEYTYSFAGWDKEVTTVSGDVTYTATYMSAKNKYTVTWKNYDGTVLETDTVEYGTVPTYDGEAPVKTSDNTYTYAFDTWDREVVAVTGNTEYIATFNETYIDYTVIFQDDDGTKLSENTYHYGDTVVEPADPTKEATDEYTYSFAGWDKEVTTVSGDVTYTAQYTTATNVYTVTWKNYDGTVLETDTVEYGTVPTYDGETPVRESDETYTYAFDTWDKEVVAVTGNTEYIATFNETYIDYTVIFQDEDGTILSDTTYHYGDTVVEAGVPTKEATAEYTYSFAGWDKEVTTVSSNVTYQATYTQTLRTYTVTWININGEIVVTEEVAYGNVPTTELINESHGSGNGDWCEYKWPELTVITEDTVYQQTGGCTYRVTWLDYDGSELEVDEDVPTGTMPIFDGELPTTVTDEIEGITYTFVGWDKEITPVTGNVTYTAQYDPELVSKYTVTWKYEDGTILQQIRVPHGETAPEYSGSTPTKESTDEFDYVFSGWKEEHVYGYQIVSMNFIAQFTEVKRSYTVTWVNEDGTVLETDTVEYGTVPTYDGTTPVKASDNTYTYTFDTWDKEVVAVTGDVTYTATFNEEYIEYTVIFQDEDGTILSDTTYHYGATIIPPADPTKAATAEYSYDFIGWDGIVDTVTKDVVYTAEYRKTKNTYTVTWVNDDGTVLETDTNVEYGTTPTYDGTTPISTLGGTSDYTFIGWTPEISTVTGDVTYTATYRNSAPVSL